MMLSGSAAARARQSGFDYGWWVVAASSAAVMMSFGPLVVFPFGLFLKELTAEFGWTRAGVSLAFSLAALMVALASPFLGRAADRWGARRVILVCSPAFGLLFASLSLLTPSLWHLYAVFAAIGLVGNGTTQLTYARIISGWFDRRRGLALALVMCGVGIGAIWIPVTAEGLIRTGGWRSAYLVLGLLAAGTATPLALLVVREPLSVERTAHAKRPARATGGLLMNRTAVSLLAAFFLASFGANGCVAHLAALLTDRGLSGQEAAWATSLLGGASLGGRLITGFLLDRFFAPRVGSLLIAGSVAAMLMLCFVSFPAAILAALLLGLSIGAEADLMPYLLGRYFGLERFGELYGYAFSVYAVAGGAGPLFMGWLFDSTGSYGPAVLLFSATTAAAAVLIARLPKYGDAEPAIP